MDRSQCSDQPSCKTRAKTGSPHCLYRPIRSEEDSRNRACPICVDFGCDGAWNNSESSAGIGRVCLCGGLAKFNSEIQAASAGTLPTWQGEKLTGHYWLEVGLAPTACVRSANLADWERIVTQLAVRQGFKDEGASFYTVVGVSDVASGEAVSLVGGQYEFAPNREYELQLYHYFPTSVPFRTRLTLGTTSRWLAFTTNPVLSLDSRYDLKRTRLVAGAPPGTERAVVSVLRDAGGGQLPYLDFDLPVRVRGVFWRTLIIGIILGLLLASTQIVTALSNPDLKNLAIVCIASVVLGLATGLVAAFGLRSIP